MRATRAYAASIGTTGVLILCSLLMLALVSAIVAFNGWPGGVVPDRIESVLLGDDETSFALSGPDQVALDAAPAAAAVAAVPVPVAGELPTGDRGLPDGAPPAGPGDPGDPDSGPGPAPAPGDPTLDPPVVVTDPPLFDPPDAGLPDLTPVAGDLVDTTVDLVAPLGDELGVPLGDGVSDTGQAVSEIVSGLGERRSVR